MSPRILIAEDDANILISIEFLLCNAGYTVVASDNGEKAWAALQAEGCDLVVLDVMLPLVNGLELCKRIRATPRLQATKILMLSARGRDTEIDTGLKLGADAYMTKPFGTREFLATVARLLAR
jgi:two-component system alkaline phosphatase synthesis response regulator PhoP